MSGIDDKICAYGQKKNLESLQEYVKTISTEELVKLIQTKLTNINFPYTWNYILQSFTESNESHNKRFTIVMTVLKELNYNEISSTQSTDIISRLCMELSKYKSKHLIELCNYCLECIQTKNVTRMSWKDLMPELLNVLTERECIKHNDVEMTGVEYKNQLINSLCMIQWSPNQIISLTAMFTDIQLTKDEHFQVVNKLGNFIEKMTPQEIPTFVYHLLNLCKHNNSRTIFLRLQNYFGVRVYDHTNVENDSESPNLDLIEDTNQQETIEAESTVLYHIHKAASMSHECIKDYLASLKNFLKSPEFLLHPFQFTVLLTISSVPHYEEKVFEILRSCISRTFHEEQKKLGSFWFKEIMPTTTKVEIIIQQIINISLEDRELVYKGLVNFGFVLLGVGQALGRDVIAEKQWELGNMILLKIVKRKRNVMPVFIQNLINRIITGSSVLQYIEFLNLLSKNFALLMLENQSSVVQLMEALLQVPANTANHLLQAIMPLTKVSPTIRDHFIILLRKALYSKVTDTRQMAVAGFLKLLTNLKISNLVALTQSSSSGSYSSGHSLFTQISINRSQCAPNIFSNEALCLEVLSILSRCFMQPVEVKTQLYDGLYDAVCMNPELGVPVLNVMWQHFSEFYVIDDQAMPPLKFNKITVVRGANVILLEPLGKLIYVIGLIVTKILEVDNENTILTKFINVFESLCSRMINCELVHFELDDGSDLNDTVPESQEKLYALKEAMCVYEALIGYKIDSWEQHTVENGKQINSLYQGYNRLIHFSKNLSKPKKHGDKKGKGDKNKSTEQSSTASQKKDSTHKSGKSFKIPDTLLNFQTLVKSLNLLHETIVSWTTMSEANVVKSKREFHQFIMLSTSHLVSTVKNKKSIDSQLIKTNYNYLLDISTVLYKRIIKRLKEFLDFDCTTGVLAVECFYNILNIICTQYENNLKSFLMKVGNKSKEDNIIVELTEFVKTYQKLFEHEDEETPDDPEIKKLSLLVINTIHLLLNQIPTTNNTLADQIIDWTREFAANNTVNSKPVATVFVNVMFESNIKFKSSLTFFEHISIILGDNTGVINEEEHDKEKFQLINDYTIQNVFQSLCAIIKSVLEDIDWIIARLKAEYLKITYDGDDNTERRREYLKNREKNVSCQLCFVVNILTNLSNCTVQPGSLSEAVLKNLILLYSTLTSLTKYFMLRSTKTNPVYQQAKFEPLVKLAGKQLAPTVYKFILYLEECQKQETQTTQTKKKTVDSSSLKSKVLKETRLIPKVVFVIEQFSKSILQLSKKTEIDLTKFLGQGTVRDYRIMHLKEVLEQNDDGTQEDDSSMNVDGSEFGNESNEEVSQPLSKKSKH